jgi:tripartite-type tricarboxylate transporter receptor subunit TctC
MRKNQRARLLAFGLLAVLSMRSIWPAILHAQGEVNFKGKTVRVIIGTSTGGGIDLWARLIAQYLGRHLAGEPGVIVQNMPGANSIVAANYMYNIAKPDGLSLGALSARY